MFSSLSNNTRDKIGTNGYTWGNFYKIFTKIFSVYDKIHVLINCKKKGTELFMSKRRGGKAKIVVTFAILFITVMALMLLVFFAGQKTHVVQFDIDGGTLISGSLEQYVTRGQDAIPPDVVKEGSYLRGWSTSYKKITKDVVIKAIWEYDTSAGITYTSNPNQNYVEISSAYKHIRGEVFIGAYYGNKKVLGILDSAFSGCVNITKVYFLDGLLSIGSKAFEGCTSLTEIEIPGTVTYIGNNAFENCVSLERLVLSEGILEIGASAFKGCTSLKEVVIPESLVKMGKDVFSGCEDLTVTVVHSEGKSYSGYTIGWQGDAEVILPEGLTKVDLKLEGLKPGIVLPSIPLFPDYSRPVVDKEKLESDSQIEIPGLQIEIPGLRLER